MPDDHRAKQMKVIHAIERQVRSRSVAFSTVSPVKDYESDVRMCLTGVHFPDKVLLEHIRTKIIEPLRAIDPHHYYYPDESLHMTIKNIRVIHDPPRFNDLDIQKASKIFCSVIPSHRAFEVYYYRLLLFPSNLALIGTTEPDLDSLIFDLDRLLRLDGIPDDKTYVNRRYFFSNVTLIRFNGALHSSYRQEIQRISDSISMDPYIVHSVSLVEANAVMKKMKVFGTWQLSV